MCIGDEGLKLSLFAGDMIFCMGNLRNWVMKLLEIINAFTKVAEYKINTQKSIVFLYGSKEQTKIMLRKQLSSVKIIKWE
jgi:hypothetical protein